MRENKSLGIKWLGHSSFEFRSPVGKVILVDPFLSGNPSLSDAMREIHEVDIIAITHGHADHVGDTMAIYESLRPKVVAPFELILLLQSKGLACSDSAGMNIGGEIIEKNIKIAMTPAMHSSTFMDGERQLPAGLACGYVFIFEDGRRLYHAGDTWLFSEMEFIRLVWKPEIVLLPIGGHYTMDVRAARLAVELLSPQIVIPMHYDTFPEISAVPYELNADLSKMGIELIVPKVGQSLEL
jgi:L-ascorbate metabolism protein UlaG (beta-lactamase superfamily)